MLYKKDKGVIILARGTGQVIIGPLRGIIENVLLTPKDAAGGIVDYMIYDVIVLDGDKDKVFIKRNVVGEWCSPVAIPAGKSMDEYVTFVVDNASHNFNFDVVVLTKEK